MATNLQLTARDVALLPYYQESFLFRRYRTIIHIG